MDIEKERKLFEKHMKETYGDLIDQRPCLNSEGFYMSWDMNVAWSVWQASANREGFVLVPVEPTEDMTIYAVDNCEYQLEHEVMASIYKDMIKASQENKDD